MSNGQVLARRADDPDMLGAVEIATLVAVCTPWADPQLAHALIMAGSGGNPWRITHADGREVDAQSRRDAEVEIANASAGGAGANSPVFVGLMQVPWVPGRDGASAGLVLLDKCTNLTVGYQQYVAAWQAAAKYDSASAPRTAIASNLYRVAQPIRQSDYATRLASRLGEPAVARPATMTDPIYHKVIAEWSAGIAARHGDRGNGTIPTMLADAAWQARRARENQ